MDKIANRQFRILSGRSYPFKVAMFLFIIALFFIIFQANVLSSFLQTEQIVSEVQVETHERHIRSNIDNIGVPGPDIARKVNPKFAAAFREEIGIKVNGTILRGVMKAHRKFYIPTSDGMFECLSGNQSIPWSEVNNDHCDCDDGSDEPGTSACKNGRFYCEPELQFISSVRVNDGLCDCCDGSDEWKGITLPDDAPIDEEQAARRAPCVDVCMDYEHSKVREANRIKEGSLAKQRYLELGAVVAGETKFGPRGEFYKLSLGCYKFKSPGYSYVICPYANATQNGKDVWVIGNGGRLEGTDQAGYKLIMENGDGGHCPDGRKRSIILTLRCGTADQVKFVSEKETCVYAAKFDTPAACPDFT